MIEQKFDINMDVNKHNIEVMIDELKHLGCECNFTNAKMNKTLLSLNYMLKRLNILKTKQTTRCELAPTRMNKSYPELHERYIHTNCLDPCSSSYKRDIRRLILAGTNITEVDITATVVYIFAKYISKDVELLNAYKSRDFYSILPNKSRDEQKKLVQIWLQGWYDPSVMYNDLFPITGEYLKQTAIKDGDLYKRNSGLFRDIEVGFLDKVLSNADLINHLHDGYYVRPRQKKKLCELVTDVWGNDVKYKVHEFAKDKFSDDDIRATVRNTDWTSGEDDNDCNNLDFTNIPDYILQVDQCKLHYDPYAALYGILLDANGDCVYNDKHEKVKVQKGYVIRHQCMTL